MPMTEYSSIHLGTPYIADNEQIAVTDKEINAQVYQLYGLTAEEIAAVEGK